MLDLPHNLMLEFRGTVRRPILVAGPIILCTKLAAILASLGVQ